MHDVYSFFGCSYFNFFYWFCYSLKLSLQGWLVSVLTQNFLDIRGFVIVMIAILIGFTVSFRLLFANVEGGCHAYLQEDNLINDCDDDPFGNLARSLLSTFELTIIGSYDQGKSICFICYFLSMDPSSTNIFFSFKHRCLV